MLRDESLQVIKDEFFRKEKILLTFAKETSPLSFYEDIFTTLDIKVPLIHITPESESSKHLVSMLLDDAVSYSEGREDILLGGCTYFKDYISMRTSKDIYAFIVDMDNVSADFLYQMINTGWRDINGHPIPTPTYIVNSGTGLHLYFVLDEVIPCYKSNRAKLNTLYRRLAMIEVGVWQSLDFQMEWFGQNFRMVGSLNKYGEINKAYKFGDYWDIDELGVKLGISETFRRIGEPPKTFPRYERTERTFTVHNYFYDSVLKRCQNEIVEGRRYLSMMALTVIAYKCAVPLDVLEKDLSELVDIYNRRAVKSQIKDREIYDALKMYNENARKVRASVLEGWLGWKFKRYNRHTGASKHPRKLTEEKRAMGEISNLEAYAWKARDEKYPNNSWMGSGRPSKQQIVIDWQVENPGKSKSECIKETGLSNKTVYKWWNNNI